jgi:hypothetical protein
MSFVLDFVLSLSKEGLILRTSLNYSEFDQLLLIDSISTIEGNYIQTGDTINIAERILLYCEPKEIMINFTVYDMLSKNNLLKKYSFKKNDLLHTKHNVILDTYTYEPKEEESGYIYSPHNSIHPYKKYSYFPPVKAEQIEYYMEVGLERELREVTENAFKILKDVNIANNMVSVNSIINVLIHLKYDPDDVVYVLNREDRKHNFWTQERTAIYLRLLRSNASNSNNIINQKRFHIWDSEKGSHLVPENDISIELRKIHPPNTYFSLSDRELIKYERLYELVFGGTISSKYKYAIIAIPDPDPFLSTFISDSKGIGKALMPYRDYDQETGPMKAFITADPEYVETLISEFEQLLKDSSLEEMYKKEI